MKMTLYCYEILIQDVWYLKINCTYNNTDEYDITQFGWSIHNEEALPTWCTLDKTSMICKELIRYKCKKSCSGRCSYKKAGLPCFDLCLCGIDCSLLKHSSVQWMLLFFLPFNYSFFFYLEGGVTQIFLFTHQFNIKLTLQMWFLSCSTLKSESDTPKSIMWYQLSTSFICVYLCSFFHLGFFQSKIALR